MVRREDILKLGGLARPPFSGPVHKLAGCAFHYFTQRISKMLWFFRRSSMLCLTSALSFCYWPLRAIENGTVCHLCVSLTPASRSSLPDNNIHCTTVFECVIHFLYFPSKGQCIKNIFFYCFSKKINNGCFSPPFKNRKKVMIIAFTC